MGNIEQLSYFVVPLVCRQLTRINCIGMLGRFKCTANKPEACEILFPPSTCFAHSPNLVFLS